ncbi:MAG: hypothetical protein ACI9DM_000231 [Cyclobacteriaceae bacterium]|jgi:hypothetical protein
MSKTEISPVMIPAFALCYIHNADMDSVTEEEIVLIEEYIKAKGIVTVGIPEDDAEAYFSPPPFGSGFLAGDYYDINCLVEI